MSAEVKPSRASPDSAHESADALAAVVNSATAVARAELRLLKAEVKNWLTRLGVGLVLLWLAMLLSQVFVLVLALSPVLAAGQTWKTLGLMLLLALLPAAATALFAARALGRLKELGNGNDAHRDQ
jgi:hypothetical protein